MAFVELRRDFDHLFEPNSVLDVEFRILCFFEANKVHEQHDVGMSLALAYADVAVFEYVENCSSFLRLWNDACLDCFNNAAKVKTFVYPTPDLVSGPIDNLVAWHLTVRAEAARRDPKHRLLERLATLPGTDDEVLAFYEEVKKAGVASYSDFDAAIDMLTKHRTVRAWAIRAMLRLLAGHAAYRDIIHDDLLAGIAELRMVSAAVVYLDTKAWEAYNLMELFLTISRTFGRLPDEIGDWIDWPSVGRQFMDTTHRMVAVMSPPARDDMNMVLKQGHEKWLPVRSRVTPRGSFVWMYRFTAVQADPIFLPFLGDKRNVQAWAHDDRIIDDIVNPGSAVIPMKVSTFPVVITAEVEVMDAWSPPAPVPDPVPVVERDSTLSQETKATGKPNIVVEGGKVWQPVENVQELHRNVWKYRLIGSDFPPGRAPVLFASWMESGHDQMIVTVNGVVRASVLSRSVHVPWVKNPDDKVDVEIIRPIGYRAPS